MGINEATSMYPSDINVKKDISNSNESFDSVFEDNCLPDQEGNERGKINSQNGIRIHLTEHADSSDIGMFKAHSIDCIPAIPADKAIDENIVNNKHNGSFSKLDSVQNGCERIRSSSYSCSQDDIVKHAAEPSLNHANSENKLSDYNTSYPSSASQSYRKSCNFLTPTYVYHENVPHLYNRHYHNKRFMSEYCDPDVKYNQEYDISSQKHGISASAPSSRRNSYEKKEAKRKSSMRPFNKPICHGSSSKSVSLSSDSFERNTANRVSYDGNSMVLHLVLPRLSSADVIPAPEQNGSIRLPSEEHLQTPNGFIANENLAGREKMHSPNFQYLMEERNEARGSVTSIATSMPTSEDEKKKVFKRWLTVILSCVYAIFLVMLGLVVYVADFVQSNSSTAEVFNIYLTVVGLIWLIFLHIDIRRFVNSNKKYFQQKNFFGKDGNEGKETELNTCPQQDISSPEAILRHHYYCFMTGRHSGSFYLKIGAAAFCFGHLVHAGLLLSRQIVYFTADDTYRMPCANVIILILDVIHPLYSFYQLFMIFKYSNVVIRRFCEVSRFAMMHIIAGNVCFWIHTIIRETVESIQSKLPHLSSNETNVDTTQSSDASTIFTSTESGKMDLQEGGLWNFFPREDICVSKTILSTFTLQAAPYLYPFTIEYSLLVAGVWFIIWFNIDKCNNECTKREASRSYSLNGQNNGDDFSSNLVIHVDCHSANRGLFAGFFVLLATVISVIIFFVAMMNEEYIKTGMIINVVSDLILLLTMSLAVLFAYRQTSKLDINSHAITFLDDILLFIALPCFFLYGIFNVVAGMNDMTAFSIIASVLGVVQVILQTPFIIDGLRRCSNTQALRYKKPGREIITFLVVCNLAMWILETFEIKSAEAHYDQFQFYGKSLWTILSHTTLPLTLFYRFHSSVCLVDIWKSAYEPGD